MQNSKLQTATVTVTLNRNRNRQRDRRCDSDSHRNVIQAMQPTVESTGSTSQEPQVPLQEIPILDLPDRCDCCPYKHYDDVWNDVRV